MIDPVAAHVTPQTGVLLALFLFDELLPYLPVKGNNLIQFISGLAKALKPFRREDEVVAQLKKDMLELSKELQSLKRSRRSTPARTDD